MICDKPMTFNLYEAEELATLVEKSGAVFARDAQLHRLSANAAGAADDPLRRVGRHSGDSLDLSAGLAAVADRDFGQKQASWRTDPMKSGAAGSFGDLGTHAFNLARYLTGLIPVEVSCNLKVFAPGRQLDDYGHAVIRYENGALGTVTISQITHGRENDHIIEVDGTKGAISWRQEDPNR